MTEELHIISIDLFTEFCDKIDFDLSEMLLKKADEELPVDYFEFYNSVSSVYSSKIEGENIDYDSFFKHKFLKVNYQPDYTKRADDLYEAYEFMQEHDLNEANVNLAHKILSRNLLPETERGRIRNNPMYVINEEDRIEYVAAEPSLVKSELSKLYKDLSILVEESLELNEIFYFASMIHLVFVKIHPFQDGNGRTARLLEKWFLKEKLDEKAFSIELEKNYFKFRQEYYNNIRILGLEYVTLNYNKALDFLLMTANSLNRK